MRLFPVPLSFTPWTRSRSALVLGLVAPLLFEAFSSNVTTAQEPSVSAKVPSADVDRPETLELGEIVKGRLGETDSTGKAHYWAVSLTPGSYKVVIDVRRADDQDSNVGGNLEWFSPNGKRIESLGLINETDNRFRGVFSFSLKAPMKAVLRYSNSFTIADYWLGIFKADAEIGVPFFVQRPPVYPLKLDEPATATLQGETTKSRDAYYSIRLAAGDYRVTAEYRRSDGKSGNVGGSVSVFDANGEFGSTLHRANEIDLFAREANKLSLADDVTVVFRMRAFFTQERVTLTIQPFKD